MDWSSCAMSPLRLATHREWRVRTFLGAVLELGAKRPYPCANWTGINLEQYPGVQCMNAEAMTFPKGQFEWTISHCVWEHIDQLDKALDECRRVTRQGGHGLHIVPAWSTLFLYPFHGYRVFTEAGIRGWCGGAGLHVERMQRYGGLGSWLVHFVCITLLETVGVSLRPSRLYGWLLQGAQVLDKHTRWCPLAYGVEWQVR